MISVKRTQTHEPVCAMFGFETTIHIHARQFHHDGLNACFFAGNSIQNLHFHIVAFRPAQIHTLEHARPIHSLSTAGASRNTQNRIVMVMLASKAQG